MNKFLAKYGKASIFTLIVILCMSFLIHLFSVSSGYLQSIDRAPRKRERPSDHAPVWASLTVAN